MQYPVVFLPAGHFSSAVLYRGLEVEIVKTIHIRVRQRKDNTENMGTRIKGFLPNQRSENRCTYEMQMVKDDSVHAGYGGIKEFLRLYD